jgi:hypothetical protein
VVRELTTDLPPAPAPHLSPTRVVVENRPPLSSHVIRFGCLAFLAVPVVLIMLSGGLRASGAGPLAVALVLVLVALWFWMLSYTRTERVWAGSDWLSSDAGTTWVELHDLRKVDYHQRKYHLIDRRGARARLDGDDLRYCPIVVDLVYRAAASQEDQGTMKGRITHALRWDAPPEWLPPKG